jgi:radical SAM superfamily enzyme YgiQ (UPF0313 family)
MPRKNVALVEPQVTKGWGQNNQYVGLLRVGHWLEATGARVSHAPFPQRPDLIPDEVYVTSMFTYHYRQVARAIRSYRKTFPEARILLGGPYATICPDHAALQGADEVIVGRHPLAKEYPPDPGLMRKKPALAYLFSSYGCNRACTYCATHILFGKGIDQTPPEQIVSEIAFLAGRGFRRIRFGDDNILFNAENHINRICELIIRTGLRMEFGIPGGMTAKELTQDTLTLMRRAGFNQFSFAIESTSQDVLRKMGRANHTGREELARAVEMCEASGIKRRDIDVYFLIGLPYQTLEDMVDTLVFLLGLGVWAHPQRLTPIPGTIEFKRMRLEDRDLADLHYKEFVAPDQDNFTGEDLDGIYHLARIFNMGSRMTKGQNWMTEVSKVYDLFRRGVRDFLDG